MPMEQTTQKLLSDIQSLTERLRSLEQKIDLTKEFSGAASSSEEIAAHFAIITEFKASIDRMRHITWLYMENIARAADIPVQAVPPALRRKAASCSIEEYLASKDHGITAKSS